MTAPGTIGRARLTEPGADFAALRAEAIRLVQNMSGEVWTDYNYSDPGVTILEQLCYALTELPYRARFPVADLLCDPRSRKLELRHQGLVPATAILPCNPVTVNDYRRLILDRVPGVANVWFTLMPVTPDQPVTGLYDVTVLPASPGPDRDGHHLVDRVRRSYTAHRSLCEDIGAIRTLEPIHTVIEATIDIDKNADPSETLGDALFTLGLMLAPQPLRSSFDERVGGNPSSSDLFTGPLMLRGFIDDDQLKPQPTVFTADQIAECLAGVNGVLTVDPLVVYVGDHRHRFTGKTAINVPDDGFLHLAMKPHDGAFSIRMRCNHARCTPDPGRVRRRLAQRWRQQRKTYPLRRAYGEHFGTPDAHYRDIVTYTSIQNQFPRVYGIAADAMPATPTPARLAKIKQLKGYLLPFDQILADSFAQLASLQSLFSTEAGGISTYRWQTLAGVAPDVDRMALLASNYEQGMDDIIAETDPVDARRGAILDLMLSFYALDVTSPTGTPADILAAKAQQRQRIATRRALLRRAALVTRSRGRGADYRRLTSSRSVAGAELLSAIELGLLDDEPDRQQDAGRPSSARTGNPDDDRFGRILPAELSQAIKKHFRGIDVDADPDRSAPSSLLAGRHIPPALFDGLLDPDAFRLGSIGGAETLLVCRGAEDSWWLIAQFGSESDARLAARALHWEAQHCRSPDLRSLYLIDWILLRDATAQQDGDDQSHYDFRITAILDARRGDRDPRAWQTQAIVTLRNNVPAHIALDYLFLDGHAMRRFDHLYHDWARVLKHGPRTTLGETSRRLVHFLRHHARRGESGDEPAPSDPTVPSPSAPPVPDAPPSDDPVVNPLPDEPASPIAPISPEPTPSPPDGPVIVGPPAVVPTPPPSPTDTPPSPTADADAAALAAPAEAPSSDDDDHRSFWSWLWWLLTWVARLLLWWRGPFATGHGGGSDDLPLPPDAPANPIDPPPPVPPALAPATPKENPDVVSAPPGAIGFDANMVLTAGTATAFRAAGFTFAVRYLSHSTPQGTNDLSAGEIATIRAAGLSLMAVQHVSPSGWAPSAALGAQHGAAAVTNAHSIGLPACVSLWLDLEGVVAGASSSDIIGYCNAWFGEVSAGNYAPGLYVGADCGLTSDQLGKQLDCAYFWKSGSTVPPVTGHGFCMVQTISSSFVVNGVDYDCDVIQADDQGNTPYWYRAEDAAS